MTDLLLAIRPFVVYGALAGMCVMLVAALCWESVRDAYVRARPLSRIAFLVAVGGITMYAGSKQRIGGVHFPFTDPEIRYLTDAGSSVSNSYVTVKFTRNVIVPATASFFVDACDIAYTNEQDIVSHTFGVYSNTFDRFSVPLVIPYANATNYDWYCYTDWTPQPFVHTNGVAYVVWQVGSTTNNLAMTRTGIYDNAVRLAPNPAMTNLPPYAPLITITTPEEN